MANFIKQYLVLVWAFFAVFFWVINFYFQHPILEKTFYSFLVFAVIHFTIKIVLESYFGRKVQDKRNRYSFKKLTSMLYLILVLIALGLIWSENTQELTVAIGLGSAGVAFALQDLLKNVAGGAIIYMTRLYSVGDRIEIDSKIGDVIDIGILYTTILEIRGWVTSDRPTGRLTLIPNGAVLSKNVNNYNRDHEFLWDEISFPLDYKSDTDYAYKKFLEITTNETKESTEKASESIGKLGDKYYVEDNKTEPTVNFALTTNEILVTIRYTVQVKQRVIIRHKISSLILHEIKNSGGKIQVATSMLDIVGFPNLKIQKDGNIE